MDEQTLTATPLRDVAVVIPTFNEEANIGPLLERLAAQLDPVSTEIVVVDDSTDATAEAARDAAGRLAQGIHVIHRALPVGGSPALSPTVSALPARHGWW